MGLFGIFNRLPRKLTNSILGAEICPLHSPATYLRNDYLIRYFFRFGNKTSVISPSDHDGCQYHSVYGGPEQKRSTHGSSVDDKESDESPEDFQSTLINPISEKVKEICRVASTHPKRVKSESSLGNFLGVEVREAPPMLVLEVLRKLSNAGILALGFFQWAEKQRGFAHSTEIYNSLIDALCKIKHFKMVWLLVESMREKGLLNKDTFMLIILGYAKSKKVSEAVETFEKMEKYCLKPDLVDFNKFLNNLSYCGQIKKAQQVFDEMKYRRFPPNCRTYSILLEGWGQEQDLSMMIEVYREMGNQGFQPDAVTYGIIINAYGKAGKIEEAMERFCSLLESQKYKPTAHTYCTLISKLGSEGRLVEALRLFQLSKSHGITPQAHIYNALVASYCNSLRFNDAYQIVEDMRIANVGPNSRTYDIILHHLVKTQRSQEAFAVFQRMNGEKDCVPTSSTYDIMVRMFCDMGRFDLAIMMWDEMKAKGVLPNRQMFSKLICGLCREKEFKEACNYFQSMLDMGIHPSGQLFSILRENLLYYGKKDMAFVLSRNLEEAKKSLLPS